MLNCSPNSFKLGENANLSMAEEDALDILDEALEVYDEFEETPEEKEQIREAYEENRSDLIDFYKQLVVMGEGEMPKKAIKKAGKSERMDTAEDLLYKNVDLLRKGSIEDMEEASMMIHKVCLAYFLLDRTRKLEELTVKTKNVSLYCLYLSLEERVCDMLSAKYYESSFMEIMDEYLDTEPILAACSELCGLMVPPLEEILKETHDSWLNQELSLP